MVKSPPIAHQLVAVVQYYIVTIVIS